MDWKDIGSTIANAAPTIGGLIGSIVPGLGTVVGAGAGTAIKAIAGAFGLADTARPEEIMAAIQADPQAVVKLKMAEMDFTLKQRDQDLEKMRIDIDGLRAQNETYLKELDTRTVPWVDAVHKMGRQILNLFNILAVCWFAYKSFPIDLNVVLLLGGPNVAYQLIKGKGLQPAPQIQAPM